MSKEIAIWFNKRADAENYVSDEIKADALVAMLVAKGNIPSSLHMVVRSGIASGNYKIINANKNGAKGFELVIPL